MIGIVDKIENNFVDFVIEETDFWFQLPKNAIPKELSIVEGSLVRFKMEKISGISYKEPYADDENSYGGFVKNPPKQELV